MNILLITSVYPSPDDSNENVTKVVRYFAKAWHEQGHNVKVIHNAHRYPALVHSLPAFIKRKISTKISFYIPDRKSVSKKRYDDGGVDVLRAPILKWKPHGGHSEKVLKKQVEIIRKHIDSEGFVPDIIMGHWMSPQIQIIAELKKIYGCKTSLVLHGRGYLSGSGFDCRPYLSYIDRLGCRSRAEAEYVQKDLSLKERPFVCYSGVPDSFVEGYSYDSGKFAQMPDTWRFIYVGRLVAYKQIDKIIKALSKLKNKNFVFDIIGSGPEEEPLKKLAEELGLGEKVILHGRMDRAKVLEFMRGAHSFVMISENEVFGLVYLEAMAASCITIGSKNEGIDGVIEDGKNGILCTAGDADQLEDIITKLMNSRPSQLAELSRRGFETAKAFTDSKVAALYLSYATAQKD